MNGAEHSPGRPVFIVDGARTPFIKAQNKPGPFTPVDLAVEAGRPLLERQPFDRRHFDEVILGCVVVHPDEVNPGRVAGLRLDLGIEVPGWTVQRNCASGLQSIDCGFPGDRPGACRSRAGGRDRGAVAFAAVLLERGGCLVRQPDKRPHHLPRS